ncbi:MAG: VWA domain-containing protein [Planctomycetes bacterium]|nr:VWA domain-containing protein [Planctomycetota bacterium]
MRLKTFAVAVAMLLMLVVSIPPENVRAGNGSVRTVGTTKFIDFCVSIRFTATAAQITNIQNAFTAANVILADATDGQFQFGNIDIVNNSGASRQAEVWINSGTGRAFATFGKFGVTGEHINLYYDSNFTSMPSADGDAYTIAHEFVHHLWGIADEYSGPGAGGTGDCEPTPGSATAEFCLMDNYFTRGGNAGAGTTYTLNELCVSANHDPDTDTFQHNRNMQSCWQTIAAHPTRSGTAPAGTPTSAAPMVTTPTYRLPAADRRFMLCIDRSGSMSTQDGGTGTPNRLDFAKQAAKIFVGLSRVGDRIGVVSFSDNVAVNLPITEIMGAGDQAAINAAIDSLATGGSTAIGSGLISSRDQFLSQMDKSCAQTIILLTDGQGNSGPSELTVIPSLVDNGISVISVAIGTNVSASNLQQVSSQTAGKLFLVRNSADLLGLFLGLFAESTGGGILARAPIAVTAGGTETVPVMVDSSTNEVAFAVTWPDSTDDLDLTVRSPSGAVYTLANAAGNPDLTAVSDTNSEILVVGGASIETGTWMVDVTGITVNTGTAEVAALSDAPGTALGVDTTKPEYTFPEPVIVQATVRFDGQSVVGSQVSGTFTRPDGSTGPITLFDDGSPASGDFIAADGNYSALFDSFQGSGLYSFDLNVVNTTGVVFAGEELFASIGVPANNFPVPPFTRFTSASAVVNGAPNAPLFSAATPCGQVLAATVGQTLSFPVSATSSTGGVGAMVTLSGNLPAGASTTPALPVTGQPASLTVNFDPPSGGTFTLTINAMDEMGTMSTCQVTVMATGGPTSNDNDDCDNCSVSDGRPGGWQALPILLAILGFLMWRARKIRVVE